MVAVELQQDEKIVIESRPSKPALIITWCAIPGVFFVFFAFTILPKLIKTAFSKTARAIAMEAVGVTSPEEFNLVGYVFDSVFGNIPSFLLVLICVPLVILVLAWLGMCLVMTYRHFQYYLAVTDHRVVGKAMGEELSAPFNEIVNVFIERSIWGKLLNYGAIVVHTKKKTLTFKNIRDPKKLYGLLMSYAEDYCAH